MGQSHEAGLLAVDEINFCLSVVFLHGSLHDLELVYEANS